MYLEEKKKHTAIEILLSIPFLLSAVGVGYMICAFLTDIRIDRLRPFITEGAIQAGVNAGVERYKEEYLKGEHLSVKKRAERDKAVQRYVKKLNEVMESQ